MPGSPIKEALEACSRLSRDNARTPMQWNAEKNAGFTTGTPWLKVNDNYTEINMETQDTDPDSVLKLLPEADRTAQISCLQRSICLWRIPACLSEYQLGHGLLSKD